MSDQQEPEVVFESSEYVDDRASYEARELEYQMWMNQLTEEY